MIDHIDLSSTLRQRFLPILGNGGGSEGDVVVDGDDGFDGDVVVGDDELAIPEDDCPSGLER